MIEFRTSAELIGKTGEKKNFGDNSGSGGDKTWVDVDWMTSEGKKQRTHN